MILLNTVNEFTMETVRDMILTNAVSSMITPIIKVKGNNIGFTWDDKHIYPLTGPDFSDDPLKSKETAFTDLYVGLGFDDFTKMLLLFEAFKLNGHNLTLRSRDDESIELTVHELKNAKLTFCEQSEINLDERSALIANHLFDFNVEVFFC